MSYDEQDKGDKKMLAIFLSVAILLMVAGGTVYIFLRALGLL